MISYDIDLICMLPLMANNRAFVKAKHILSADEDTRNLRDCGSKEKYDRREFLFV